MTCADSELLRLLSNNTRAFYKRKLKLTFFGIKDPTLTTLSNLNLTQCILISNVTSSDISVVVARSQPFVYYRRTHPHSLYIFGEGMSQKETILRPLHRQQFQQRLYHAGS